MKRAVVSTGLHDADIRPKPLLSEFKRLSVEDAATHFSPTTLTEVCCPACGESGSEEAFEKQEFSYRSCRACDSWYVSPRPTQNDLARYYQESRASRYRVEHFARETAHARRRHLLRQHAQWIGRLVDENHAPLPFAYADIGTSSAAIFEEVGAIQLFESVASIAPLPGLESELAARDIVVHEGHARNLSVITAFEQLEHQFDPLEFLNDAAKALAPGGLLFLTTRSASGFDLRILGGAAPYIFVPEHLNLLSIEGLQQLIHRAGLELVELSTPGQLDIELVRQAVDEDPTIEIPAFARELLDKRDARAHEDFQAFLQKHRLSSHVRVAVRKPKE